MVSRPYKCPLCNSAFRNESGMKWHAAHRHEIPTAFDALGKDYEANILNLQKENDELGKRVQQIESELGQTKMNSIKELAERVKVEAENAELNRWMKRAIFAIVGRDQILKEKLNITMPDPFKGLGQSSNDTR